MSLSNFVNRRFNLSNNESRTISKNHYMSFSNVGKVWTPASLEEYLKTRKKPNWATSVTIHHTAAPSLAQRPNGFTIQHIINMQSFYQKPKDQGGQGWTSGPHLFIDDDQIFGMCDLSARGIHAASFNSSSIGIEVLGFYDKNVEDPKSGRGLACWKNTAATVKVLLDWLELKPTADTVKFHRDDPKTKKTCPGTAVEKSWFLNLIPKPLPMPVIEKPLTTPPDVGFPWTKWHYIEDKWCVPIVDFLVAAGMNKNDVLANLTSKNGMLFFQGDLIHGGFYVKKGEKPLPNETSWAPARELMIMKG